MYIKAGIFLTRNAALYNTHFMRQSLYSNNLINRIDINGTYAVTTK